MCVQLLSQKAAPRQACKLSKKRFRVSECYIETDSTTADEHSTAIASCWLGLAPQEAMAVEWLTSPDRNVWCQPFSLKPV